jgi:menaquinol-cytochrome c reductase iron-sulfur subunit
MSEQSTSTSTQNADLTRRNFLMKVGIALNAVVALAIATPVVAYLLGPVLKRKDYPAWVSLGGVDDFAAGETKLVTFANPYSNLWDGLTAQVPAYVRRTGSTAGASDFTVFAINCAHLGCPVRWFKESQLFMCPCHGGVYYADGSRASGPPERGLFTYDLKLDSGKLLIYAGQLPTLSNRASNGDCPGAKANVEPKLVTRIEPWPKTEAGTGKSTIG